MVDNFRMDYLNFEVADFKSSYHAINGHINGHTCKCNQAL
jgi:hypothetical protein